MDSLLGAKGEEDEVVACPPMVALRGRPLILFLLDLMEEPISAGRMTTCSVLVLVVLLLLLLSAVGLQSPPLLWPSVLAVMSSATISHSGLGSVGDMAFGGGFPTWGQALLFVWRVSVAILSWGYV